MLLFRKKSLIAIAGGIWVFIGLLLLIKGCYLLLIASKSEGEPLIHGLANLFSLKTPSILIILTGAGLVLGWLKGRFLLMKSVKRTIERLQPLTGLIHFSTLYRLQDYLLISGMIILGRFLQWIRCPSDLRGLLNVAIGSALLVGAVFYFRFASKEKAEEAL